MLNKRIRGMIDDIFSEMKMSAENLALRDELLANAQARFEDLTRAGQTEEEALEAVMASLGDVRALVDEMNTENLADAAKLEDEPEEEPEVFAQKAEAEEAEEGEPAGETPFDLGDMLNKTVSALGDLGEQIVPQTKRVIRKMDKATGGILLDVGRAVNRGMRDAQKAAGEMIDRMNQPRPENAGTEAPDTRDAGQLRSDAEDLRTMADLKQASGDAENAEKMRSDAEVLENRAAEREQEEAMEAARREAEAQIMADDDPFAALASRKTAQRKTEQPAKNEETCETDEAQDDPFGQVVREKLDAQRAETLESGDDDVVIEINEQPAGEDGTQAAQPDYLGADGEINEDAFARVVETLAQDAEEAARQAGEAAKRVGEELHKAAKDAGLGQEAQNASVSGSERFPAAGLRRIEVSLDGDSIRFIPADVNEIEVEWRGLDAGDVPEIGMAEHTLYIKKKNPDIFKSFFSVFRRSEGEIVVRVPVGYAADYAITTVSGGVRLYELDVDDVKICTTSGSVRFQPDAGAHAKGIDVTSVSGDVTVSATAERIAATSVSGELFVSCDASTLKTHSVSGKTHAEGSCDEWDCDSVSGAIELFCTTVPGRSVKLSTVSAGATVVLPEEIRGFTAELNGKSSNIKNAFGPNRYGTCALPIRMESMSGSLNIRQM